MNTLRKTTLAMMTSVSLMVMASGNANAAQVSTEQAVSQFVVAQGKQVMANLADQLKGSIAENLSQFSIDSAVDWSQKQTESATVKQDKQTSDKTAEEE